VIWVHSTSKAARDANARQAKVEAGLAAIEAVAERLSRPESRLRTKVAAEEAAVAALATAGASRFVGFVVNEEQEETYSQERRGRPGADTRYRKRVKTVFNIEATTKADVIAYDAATDGCFPLVTNSDELSPAKVLEIYRHRPNLERRNHMLKGPQAVAPVFIEHPHRIEAILLCHFLAMLAEALIEREIRTSMKAEGLSGIPLYPELRNCPSPSAPRILEIFGDAQHHRLMSKREVVQVFDPELTELQQQVLDLLHVPASVYASSSDSRGGGGCGSREVRNVRSFLRAVRNEGRKPRRGDHESMSSLVIGIEPLPIPHNRRRLRGIVKSRPTRRRCREVSSHKGTLLGLPARRP
jgi:hypothetical protein